MPDLDDRDVDGSVGEAGERHRGQHLEVAHPWRSRPRAALRIVDHLRRRGMGPRHAAVTNRLGARTARRVENQGALAHVLEVWAGEPSGVQAEGAQQRLDHAGGRGLAVRAGQVHHGVGALRVGEQVEHPTDPVEARLEHRLRPAGGQRRLDAGQLREGRVAALGGGHDRVAGRAAIAAVSRATSASADSSRPRILATTGSGALPRKSALPSLACAASISLQVTAMNAHFPSLHLERRIVQELGDRIDSTLSHHGAEGPLTTRLPLGHGTMKTELLIAFGINVALLCSASYSSFCSLIAYRRRSWPTRSTKMLLVATKAKRSRKTVNATNTISPSHNVAMRQNVVYSPLLHNRK